MGAFISYLYLAHGVRNFVLAPTLTIYNKLIIDFTPNTPNSHVVCTACGNSDRTPNVVLP